MSVTTVGPMTLYHGVTDYDEKYFSFSACMFRWIVHVNYYMSVHSVCMGIDAEQHARDMLRWFHVNIK